MAVNVEGIKKLLSKEEGAEIRIGLKNAESMGLDFSDESIVELFESGIAVDVIIKKVDSEDFLPNRLERPIKMVKSGQDGRDDSFVKIKIVDILKGEILKPVDIYSLLIGSIQNGFKVVGYIDKDSNSDPDGFTDIVKVIGINKGRFLNLKEIRYLLGIILPNDKYEFLVKEDMAMAAKKGIEKDTKNDTKKYIETVETTEKYWDCECKKNFIHPKSQQVCFKCNAVAGDQPDSRINEVLAQGLPL